MTKIHGASLSTKTTKLNPPQIFLRYGIYNFYEAAVVISDGCGLKIEVCHRNQSYHMCHRDQPYQPTLSAQIVIIQKH